MSYKKRHSIASTLLTSTVLFLTATQAHALAIPRASAHDPRIQTVVYDPNNVVNIKAKIGRAVLIQLEDDERLDSESSALGMGDSNAWDLAVKGNNIMFKPKMENPDTNLIITTNKRTYAFQLSVADSHTSNQDTTYILRFKYPDTARAKQAAEEEKNQQAMDILEGKADRLDVDIRNDKYYGYGDKALAPTQMFDDGQFTYLIFSNAKELPAVYKKMPDGTESLVNMHIKGDAMVVHELAAKFVLRLGQSVLGIENRGYDDVGQFNDTGTTMPNAVRIIKEADPKPTQNTQK